MRTRPSGGLDRQTHVRVGTLDAIATKEPFPIAKTIGRPDSKGVMVVELGKCWTERTARPGFTES